MIIKNAQILMEDFRFYKKDINFENIIKNIEDNINCDEFIDANGLYLIPGLIDIHTHGCAGVDGCDADVLAYRDMSNLYAKGGTTSFLMTTMTLPIEKLENILDVIAKFIKSGEGASNCSGIYLEGPFFNIKKKGAQYGEYMISPNIIKMDKLISASQDNIKVIAFAPEIEDSENFIKEYSSKYAMSMAHTMADYETAKEAIKLGVSSVTHLFNAMPSYSHRQPGVVGATFDSDIFIEIISDGVHIHPAVIRNTFKTAGEDRMVLVSDSIRATGMTDGEYTLGGQKVTVKGKNCILANGTIAGSATNLFDCLKKAIEFGVKKETAIKAATLNPAKLIGIDKVTGSIERNKRADLLLVNEKFELQKVFVNGEEVII